MSDGQGSPGTYRLSDPEQRLLDYIRAGTLDAEIAVRMGVPVGDVKDRIASLVYKLNLHSRAELATWNPEIAPPRPPDTLDDDAEPQPVAPSVHSRRSVLTSALAGAAAVAAGGGGILWLARSGSTGSNGVTPTPSGPSSTPTPPPDAAGTGIGAIVRSPGAFDRYGIKAGTPITAEHGLFFMDTKGGDIEAWQLRDSLVQDYDTNPHNTYVVARNRTRNVSYIADRRSGETFSWPSDELFFIAASRSTLLFEEASTAATRLPGAGSGRHHLLDANFSRLRSFTVDDPPDARSSAVFSPDATDILLWREAPVGSTQSLWGQAKVWHVDAPSGAGDPIPGATGTPSRQPYFLADGGEVLLLFASYNHTKILRTNWKGGFLSEASFPSPEVYPSPSGSYVAWDEPLPLSGTLGGDSWPSVVITRGSTLPGFPTRIRSASLTFGDNLIGTRWLPDSSGLVVQVRDESAATPSGLPPVAYAVLRAVDGAILPLPPLPQHEAHWFTESRTFGPLPSPNSSLISFGRLAVLETKTGEWLPQAEVADRAPAHLAPWGTTSDEMRFILPNFGRSTPPVHALLNPQRERSPEDYAFVVARTGDWLNLRAAPDLDSEVLTRLVDGTRLEPAPAERFVGAVQFNDSGMWVRVRTPDAREGWVNAAYLDWA